MSYKVDLQYPLIADKPLILKSLNVKFVTTYHHIDGKKCPKAWRKLHITGFIIL